MEKLDRSKPYQEIQGESFGAKWEQNGKLFTARGGLIYSEPAKPTQLEPEVEPEKAEAEVLMIITVLADRKDFRNS